MKLSFLASILVLLGLVLVIILGMLISSFTSVSEPVTSTLYLTLTKIETTYITVTRIITITSFTSFTRQYECVVFSTMKDTFRISDSVELLLINNCNDSVILPSSAPWKIESLEGGVVFKPVSLQVLVEVRPGEEIRWAWDQKDNNNKQVPAGCYYAIIDTLNKGSFRYGFCIK